MREEFTMGIFLLIERDRERGERLAIACVFILATVLWVGGTSALIFYALSKMKILRANEKLEAAAFAPVADKVNVSDIMAVRETAPHMASAFADHARAFLEVQNGCDHRCTFCIIPYGRGNSRSVPAGAVLDKAKQLVDAGYREIVLTGVDVTSYGPDLPGRPSLGLLVERILMMTRQERTGVVP